MSDAITRCFIAEGDIAKAMVDRIRKHNEEVSAKADAIKDEIGAESIWFGQGDGFCKGVKFADNKPRKGFKEVRDGVKWPVKNTAEGKALGKRLSELRRKSATSEVEDVKEFKKHWGAVIGRYINFPVGIMFPYKDDPKIVAKMAMRAETEYSVPEGWREIKEWEFLKMVEEWNATVPAKPVTESAS
jgi:hypothetical protein